MKQLSIRAKRLLAATRLYGPCYPLEAALNYIGTSSTISSKAKRQKLYPHMTNAEKKEELKRLYKCGVGKSLNLDHPVTFNEKLQWLKLYGGSDFRTRLIDKLMVKNWVAKTIGEKYVVPLLGYWKRFDDINFSDLPERFVLKCNHGAGYCIFVDEKSNLDMKSSKEKVDRWMTENYAYGNMLELQYEDIKPMVLAEEYLENQGKDLPEYKVFCYSGKPIYTQFLCNRKNGLRMAFFNNHWEKQSFRNCHAELIKSEVPRPDNHDEILEIAAKLSRGFPFVRVDLYRLDDGTIKFGEMTFIPAGGMFNWIPESLDLVLGEPLILPNSNVNHQ